MARTPMRIVVPAMTHSGAEHSQHDRRMVCELAAHEPPGVRCLVVTLDTWRSGCFSAGTNSGGLGRPSATRHRGQVGAAEEIEEELWRVVPKIDFEGERPPVR
jgi:hypothetical protein